MKHVFVITAQQLNATHMLLSILVLPLLILFPCLLELTVAAVIHFAQLVTSRSILYTGFR